MRAAKRTQRSLRRHSVAGVSHLGPTLPLGGPMTAPARPAPPRRPPPRARDRLRYAPAGPAGRPTGGGGEVGAGARAQLADELAPPVGVAATGAAQRLAQGASDDIHPVHHPM